MADKRTMSRARPDPLEPLWSTASIAEGGGSRGETLVSGDMPSAPYLCSIID
jgi:hypothetical protein